MEAGQPCVRKLLVAAAALSVSAALVAAPHSPELRHGSADIQLGTGTVIRQHSDRVAIDWGGFDLTSSESVRFLQPSASSLALNRVVSGQPSSILGKIESNGRVILVNTAGILFGSGARLDTGAFVASTLDLDMESFAGGRLVFRGNGASVENFGTLRGTEFVAIVSPVIVNHGVVTGGSAALASGAEVVIETSSGLFGIQVPVAAVRSSIENSGGVVARDGSAYLTAKGLTAAASSLSNAGRVEASGLVERDGRVFLESTGSTTSVGQVSALRASDGGDISIEGGFVALGGSISADGAKGGTVKVESKGMLSLAEHVTAKGLQASGGSITYHSLGQTIENSTGFSDVSGRTDGGKISLDAEQGVMSSGTYLASGAAGKGGMIDLTGYGVRLLSATLDASGRTQGGLIRVGGAFQGGKNLGIRGDSGDLLQSYVGRWNGAADISNAQRTLVNDSSVLKVSATSGEGGTAIIWSDLQTTMAGKILAGGVRGGVAEISSAEELRKAAIDQVVGARHILLDPKNIVIGATAEIGGWTYSAIIGNGYTGAANLNLNPSSVSGQLGQTLEANDYLGSSVAISGDGALLVIGSPEDDGFGNSYQDTGSVRLFSSDQGYTAASVLGTIGSGYAGSGNINISLDTGDQFGRSVALSKDGLVLAVGAPGDAGNANTLAGSGCVWLFSFTGTQFGGGALYGRVGYLYPGPINSGWSTQLKIGDGFGWSVALNQSGSLMAVGSPFEDDTNPLNYKSDRGNVRLFSLDTSGAAESWLVKDVVSSVFSGYSNNPGAIEQNDYFGWSVALNGVGDRLAVGAPGDDGDYNGLPDVGVVRLYAFSDNLFSGGSVVAFLGNRQSSWYDSWKVINVLGILNGDLFGSSVSLSSDGTTLAVGAPGDDGYADTYNSSGAVHLFKFNDSSFNGGAYSGSIGNSYTGGKNIHVTGLAASDFLGTSVALSASGDRLAVGARGDDGTADNRSNGGAVYVFGFSDTSFNGGSLLGAIGYGYAPVETLNTLDGADRFGLSISMNAQGDRLAVGAPGDDGATYIGSGGYGYGNVRLFTFSDDSFTGGALVGVIGKGYTGGRNIDVASLDAGDNFGASVSLNGAGDRLAVGAPGDDGATYIGSGGYEYGNVRLFTFLDASFLGGALSAIIGHGYSGGYNINLLGAGGDNGLDVGDRFGAAVSLNALGTRLAVGAPGDDGAQTQGDRGYEYGNVRIFNFSNTSFAFGLIWGIIGKDEDPIQNFKWNALHNLDIGDAFGTSVSFNATGNLLAVGAPGDDGALQINLGHEYGSVRLFNFSGTSFEQAYKGTVGKGYGIGADDLDVGDSFGSAVALNATGDRLAVGAPGDDGATYVGDGGYEYGSVRMFSFVDGSFTGGTLFSVIGKGYAGSQNLNLVSLDAGDRFGSAVSFDSTGDRLAAGAPGDDGATYVGSGSYEYGSVFLLRLGGVPLANNTFGFLPGTDSLINSTQVAAALASGTALTLQANNDIAITSPIDAGAGSSGELLLYAGRSVRFDADVRIGTRDLGVVANASAADGVIGAHRDAGQGGFSMASGVSVQAGTFGVLVRGADTSISNPNSSPGSVTLGNLNVSSLAVGILGLGLSGRTVSQLVGSSISVSGAVTIVNQAGGIQLANSSNGSWAGLVGLAGVGDVQARVSGSLVLDDLVASSFDVRSTGALTASGDITLADAGLGMLSGTNVSLSGLVDLGAGADLRVNANDSITLAGFVPDLGAGAMLRLYACDDLTISSSVVAAAGSLGEIRLTAGRDLKIDADLRLGGADLLARANARVSDGIFGSYRPTGQGDFTMAAGTTLTADSVTVIVRGADSDPSNPNSSPGSLIFANVSAGTLTASIEGSGLTGRNINQYVASSISSRSGAAFMNLNGSIFLNASGNGAMRGTVSMIASESAKLRTSSALKLSALQGSVLDVQSAGPMTLTGGFSAGSSGYSLLRAPGVEIAGPVSLGAYATVNVVADGEMRLTGSSASLGLDAHLKLWSENLAIDTTNRIGYTYRVYGATYGVTNNPSNRGIGWFYGVTSPYAAWAPPGAAAPEGVTLSSATYVRPLHPLLFGPFIPSIAPRMPLFRQAGAEFFPSEPAEPLSPRDEEQEEPSQPARPAVSSLR